MVGVVLRSHVANDPHGAHPHTRARPNLVKGQEHVEGPGGVNLVKCQEHVEGPLIDRKLVLLVGIGSRRGAVAEIVHADNALAWHSCGHKNQRET